MERRAKDAPCDGYNWGHPSPRTRQRTNAGKKDFTMNVLERNPSRWYAMLVAGGIALTVAAQSRAAEPSKDAAPNSATAKADDGAKAADTKPAETKALKGPLDAEQKRLADRYTELEKSMNRMAEVIGQTDPKQASLLHKPSPKAGRSCSTIASPNW